MKGGISVDWSKIKAEYIAGGTSYRKLARKYCVSESKLTRIAVREKWNSLAKQRQSKTDAKVVDKIAQDQADCATIISDTTVALLKQMAKEVAEDSLTSASAGFYKDAADALRKFKEVVGVKSPQDAEEQEARILNLRRQAETEPNKDQTIVVQFEGAEAYSE